MKKLLSLLLIAAMLLSLCACGEPDSGNDRPNKGDDPETQQPGGSTQSSQYHPVGGGENGLDQDVAELICGTWYPDPQVSDGCIEFRNDGICNLYGEEMPYQVVDRNEEEITVDANGIQMIFLVRNPAFAVLFEESCGFCIGYPDLWQFAGNWHCEETNQDFYLDIGEIPYWDFDLQAGPDFMSIGVLDGEELLYHIIISPGDPPVAEVVDAVNNRHLYFYHVGNMGSDSCDHVYTVVSTQPGTCQQNGSETLQCKHCGHQRQRDIGLGEHSYVDKLCQYCGAEKPQGQLAFELSGEGTCYTVVGIGTWDEPEVVIPAEYNGLPVQSIWKNAFKDCAFIEKVVVPESVLVIHSQAFSRCTALKTVELSEGLLSIGDNAFAICESLENIRIPDSVTSMGGSVFFSCSSLKECTIPDGVRELGGSTFYGCISLTSVTLPDSMFYIGEYAFVGCTSLKQIDLPENLNTIGAMAFERCTALESIEIPERVTELKKWAFGGCYNLSITIPKQIEVVGEGAVASCKEIRVEKGNADYYVKDNCLIQRSTKTLVCAGLEFSIPTDGSVTGIGGFAFVANPMSSIAFPDCIKTLGDGMFSGCDNLKTVKLPKGIKKLADNMFVGCPIEHIEIPNTVTHIGFGAFQMCENLKTVVIPDSVTEIGEYAFAYCYALESIVIPDSITELKGWMFQQCTALKTVVIPDSVTVIGSTFHGCTALESIVLPNSVTKLDGTFYGCTALKSIVIPESVTFIGENTFRECESLESVTVPDSVMEMGRAVFMDCSNLKQVVLPSELTFVPELTFSWCESLETVTIGANVTAIQNHVFVRCNKLKTIYFGGTEEQWSKIQVAEYNEALANAEIVCP